MEENAPQVQMTPEQTIEFIFEALSVHREEFDKIYEEIKRIDASIAVINLAIHHIGNMVAGKLSVRELEILVKQMVEDQLKLRESQ